MSEQPRVPAGQPTGGQWSSPGGGGGRGVSTSRGDWSGAGPNPSASTNKEREERLEGPVKAVKDLPGGISETYKVTLEDGTVGNFKVDSGEFPAAGRAENEVFAWEVAKIVGMEDMVPPATIREVDIGGTQRRGSYAEWVEGAPAKRVRPDKMFGNSEDDVQRAAIFDFIVGNTDRHEGNWVINDGKIGLIDHNMIFDRSKPYSQFLFRIGGTTLKDKPVASYVKPYVDNLDKIISVAVSSGGAARADGPQIQWLKQRVELAKKAKTWNDITKVANEQGWYSHRSPTKSRSEDWRMGK